MNPLRYVVQASGEVADTTKHLLMALKLSECIRTLTLINCKRLREAFKEAHQLDLQRLLYTRA